VRIPSLLVALTCLTFFFWHSLLAATEYDVNARFLSVRNRMFNLSPADLADLFPQRKPEVWGAAVEEATGSPFYFCITVFTFADADKHTSIYTSRGAVFSGLGSSPTIAEISRSLLAKAERSYQSMSRTDTFPLPAPGRVRIYVFTLSGAFTDDVAKKEIENEGHPLHGIYNDYWEIRFKNPIKPKLLSAIFIPSVFCGILFIVISLPLLRGSIPMNRFYGFRISKAFASDTNWYAINKYGAKVLILWSIVMIVSGVLFLLLGLPSPLPGLIPLVICTAAAIGQTLRFAGKLKNSNDEKAVKPVNQGDGE
jgi:hypothetical protein